MPQSLKIRKRALRDLVAIVRYIAKQNRNFVDAQRFGNKLLDACHGLTSAPGQGTPYGEGTETRKIIVGPYRIIYRTTSEKVVIMRIWDGRRGRKPKL
jgi:plasmid stabilization system protein ParE